MSKAPVDVLIDDMLKDQVIVETRCKRCDFVATRLDRLVSPSELDVSSAVEDMKQEFSRDHHHAELSFRVIHRTRLERWEDVSTSVDLLNGMSKVGDVPSDHSNT
jgi:hypothetical protein